MVQYTEMSSEDSWTRRLNSHFLSSVFGWRQIGKNLYYAHLHLFVHRLHVAVLAPRHSLGAFVRHVIGYLPAGNPLSTRAREDIPILVTRPALPAPRWPAVDHLAPILLSSDVVQGGWERHRAPRWRGVLLGRALCRAVTAHAPWVEPHGGADTGALAASAQLRPPRAHRSTTSLVILSNREAQCLILSLPRSKSTFSQSLKTDIVRNW